LSCCPRDECDDEDAGKIRERAATNQEYESHDQAEDREQRLGAERPELYERDWIGSDESGVFQTDERQEDADARGSADTQLRRNRFRDRFTDRCDGDQEKQHAGPEDDAERRLPPDFLRQDDREREVGVDAHAGRDGERQLRVETHQQSHHETDEHRGS